MSDDKLRAAGISNPQEIPEAVRKELEKLSDEELKSLVQAKRKISDIKPFDNIGILIF